jgi:ribosomal protein S18 acetylase RimI-like enzyme
MRPDELDSAVSVWREANVARGAPHGRERTDRVRAKLSASDALAFVALRPRIVGMALAEPGRFDDGAGEPDPSLLHISMVFVHPAAQRSGVGLPLVLHVLDIAGKSAPFHGGTQLQYGCLLNGERAPRPAIAT